MIKGLTFPRGIFPPHKKKMTENLSIEVMPAPDVIVLPLCQHIGISCSCMTAPGDKVLMGQQIGDAGGYISAPVHSPVSGVVKSIEDWPSSNNGTVQVVIIENDGLDEKIEGRNKAPETPEEFLDTIEKAGIVGMGGATFPTHVKLKPPTDKKIDTLIINGAECEPYLTADHVLMLEYAEKIAKGVSIVARILDVDRIVLGIEINKPDAIEKMESVKNLCPGMEIVQLKVKYPQGGEKQLIQAVTQRQVPSGGLPMDVGVVVLNVGTTAAIYDAVEYGKPLYERILTVSGDGAKKTKNLLVRVGTAFEDVINYCGGLGGDVVKVISGGPMMGKAQYDMRVSVTKATSGILLLTESETKRLNDQPCIRCGRCSDVCPINLMPLYLCDYSNNGFMDKCEEIHVMDCIECGCCTYICPARRNIVQAIQSAKRDVSAVNRAKSMQK